MEIEVKLKDDVITETNLGRLLRNLPGVRPSVQVSGDYSQIMEQRIKEEIYGYFKGEVNDFNLPCRIKEGTDFQKKVWEQISEIEYGEVATYKDIAEEINQPEAYQAVGQALSFNPIPLIIPCHRVIREDGDLGGFTAETSWKEFLISFENGGR